MALKSSWVPSAMEQNAVCVLLLAVLKEPWAAVQMKPTCLIPRSKQQCWDPVGFCIEMLNKQSLQSEGSRPQQRTQPV